MESEADELVSRTDPALWHTTRYMPRTRDLSKGKRDLIRRWAATLRGGARAPVRARRGAP